METAGGGAGEKGSASLPLRAPEMCGVEMRLGPPVTSQERWRPINTHNGHISPTRFVSLTYMLSLSICSLEACFMKGSWEGGGCSDLEDVTLMRLFFCFVLFCCAASGMMQIRVQSAALHLQTKNSIGLNVCPGNRPKEKKQKTK